MNASKIVVVLAVALSGVCFGPGGAGVAAMCGWIALRDSALTARPRRNNPNTGRRVEAHNERDPVQ